MSPPAVCRSASVLADGVAKGHKRPRKNSTRACDTCKARKIRCDGTQPCARCTRFHTNCTYESKYTRGTLVTPMRSSAVQTDPIYTQLPPLVPASDARSVQNIDGEDHVSRIEDTLDAVSLFSSSHDPSPTRNSTPRDIFVGGHCRLQYPQAARVELESLHKEAARNNHPTENPDSSHLASSGENTATNSREFVCTSSYSSYPYRRLPQKLIRAYDEQQFWFTESPMREVDSSYLALPSKKHARKLVSWYFDNASPTYRILHRPLLEEWIDSGFHAEASPFDSDAPSEMECAISGPRPEYDNMRRRLLNDRCISALIFSVWAMGCQFPVGLPTVNGEKWKGELRYRSQQYLLIAQNELSKDKSSPDMLIKLQAQFIMCQYLLTTSRVKEAWDLLVTVKNIANNLGLNRRGKTHCSTWHLPGRLQIELRKRAFWAIYTLESYMCTMLGKTLTWAEEDITTDWPAIARFALLQHVSDTEGEAAADAIAAMDCGESRSQPSLMYSLIAHAKVSRIVRSALRKLYRDMPSECQEDIIDDLASQVDEWERMLPMFLKPSSQTGGLRLPYSRQVDIIHIAHAHALILIYRPSLNLMDASFRQTNGTPTLLDVSARRRRQQDRCLEAAMSVAEMDDFANISGSNWFIAYVVFCAVTVMFVYLTHHPLNPNRQLILLRVRKLCNVEMSLSRQSDMAKRYVFALKELWVQVQKYLQSGAQAVSSPQTTCSSMAPASVQMGTPSVSMSGTASPMIQSAHTPLNGPSFKLMSEGTTSPPVQMEPGLWTFDHSGLISPDYVADIPCITDCSVPASIALPNRTETGTARNESGLKSSEDVFSRTLLGDLLGSLSQSFQGFDCTASAGYAQCF
ncbi:fungal-specific transcription factor domain-containing protein [Lipomyces starkeyi]